MYVPSKFRVDDPAVIHSFVRENPFGVLLSIEGDEIHDTHTPFLISDNGMLLGHIARANPQWQGWGDGTSVKVIFTGPHSYISPQFYTSEFNVPTWNYTAVSVTGKLMMIEDESRVLDFLDALVAENEDSESPWKLDRDDERFMKMLSAIVVFSVSMDRVDASFKLNQNKAADDQQSVVDHLKKSGCPMDGAVASKISRNLRDSDDSVG